MERSGIRGCSGCGAENDNSICGVSKHPGFRYARSRLPCWLRVCSENMGLSMCLRKNLEISKVFWLVFFLILSVTLLGESRAGGGASIEATANSVKITKDSVDLTARDFFVAYASNNESARAAANLYLLGVMDATEGRSWCDYRTYKTVTLRERIFVSLKKMDPGALSNRASTVIEGILSERFPCGSKK